MLEQLFVQNDESAFGVHPEIDLHRGTEFEPLSEAPLCKDRVVAAAAKPVPLQRNLVARYPECDAVSHGPPAPSASADCLTSATSIGGSPGRKKVRLSGSK